MARVASCGPTLWLSQFERRLSEVQLPVRVQRGHEPHSPPVVRGGVVAADVTAAGCSTTPSQYLASLNVTDGEITATSQATGATPAECTLTLTPAQAGTFEITQWAGTFGGCASKFVPSSFR